MEHTIPPFYDQESKILILGSFPSVKSRQANFYYAHPQNRFYKVISAIYEQACPHTICEKKALLSRHHLALFDVIQSCKIKGSSDASIKEVIANDLRPLLNNSQIQIIITNGKKAHQLYQKYIFPVIHIQDVNLPSTSPANATFSLDRLVENWKQYLNKD